MAKRTVIERLNTWWYWKRDWLVVRVETLFRRCRHRLFRWYWHDLHQEWQLRFTRWGRPRASVWLSGTWHTWDVQGIGGENAEESCVWKAKLAARDALERQGWI